MENIKDLVIKKKKLIETEEDMEKISVIEELLLDESCFFKMDIETAIGILDFLGVSEDNIMDYYYSLISFENFSKIPSVRYLDEELLNNKENKL